ncbi:glycerone kinase [Neisseria macacae ATCC 33926]|uniref:Glycerone kinase n=1 Tax=Neisseria macacae ATCC 33926 TaxID=997348 RepID=A0AA36UHR0_9NEIS|nr:glycerone kinase [Neisseria macacae ATCC 33926]
MILYGLGIHINYPFFQIKYTVSLFSDGLNSVICNDKYRLIYLKDTTNKGRLKTVPEIEETDIFRRP